jgi:hypothetical protein
MSPDNVRRMLEETVAAANISLLAAAGADPAWIMQQVGHTDPKLTLRIYTQVMKRKRSEDYRARANELLGAHGLVPNGATTRSTGGEIRPANRPTVPNGATTRATSGEYRPTNRPTNDKAPLTVPVGWAGEGPESA